ncbi:hypothetical protein T4D_9172 [Trichinella pseudospiralis]|uniref:Uncharacterized protein n=1 Tax=Trichinella pseudospiralis TaxID=6337 RepID=A0A0V1FVS3_TRIPS|nr:hypothetical protein T4D_9172 [Trichinella pseudospiralis]
MGFSLNHNNLLDLVMDANDGNQKCTAIWKRNGDIGNIYMYLRSWMQKLNDGVRSVDGLTSLFIYIILNGSTQSNGIERRASSMAVAEFSTCFLRSYIYLDITGSENDNYRLGYHQVRSINTCTVIRLQLLFIIWLFFTYRYFNIFTYNEPIVAIR